MDVDVLALEKGRLDAKGVAARFDIAFGGLHRLLHHIAQFAGRGHPSLAGYGYGFDRQQFAADLGPGEPGRDPDHVLALGLAESEFPNAGVFVEIAPGHDDLVGLLHQNVLDRLAGQVGDFAFEIADPRFARVVPNQVAKRFFADAPFVLFETVRLDLFRDQVTLGNFNLLVLGVAGETDDLHTVH